MDLKLSGGDFVAGENGKPQTVLGKEELFQRAEIRLTVPLGSFSCNPGLGSRLHTLKEDTPLKNEKALSMAQEALKTLTQVTVTGAEYTGGETPCVKVTLRYAGEERELEVQV